MLPLGLFRSAQFSGSNIATLAIYAGLGGALFLVVLQLQLSLRYSALAAGTSLLPITVLMLALSARVGGLARKVGPRLPMTLGPLTAAAGLLLLARIRPGSHYAATVLPAAVVFGLGLTLTVAPLTATVLASVEERHAGLAAGVNNAVARLAGLLAVAALPGLANIETGAKAAASLASGFPLAMRISAGVCALGGLASLLTIRTAAPVKPLPQAGLTHPCLEGKVPASVGAPSSPPDDQREGA